MKKLLKEILNILNKNYKFIISIILILLIFSIKFPYYVDAPGGITDMKEKIEIDGYDSIGSFNLTYVREYRGTIPILLIAMFNKDWKIINQKDVLLETEDDKSYELRDKILMKESISNAIYVAYTKANKKIDIISNQLLVTYIAKSANTNLVVGDEIKSINNKKVNNKEEITDIVNNLNIGDKLNIKVINNEKEYHRYAYVIEEENSKKIGILISNVKQFKTDPEVKVNVDKNESGSSGGLVTSLAIYNSLVKEDITNELTIVCTGTIDDNGNIGSIGGVEYKIKSAVKANADLFIVPNDGNYEQALKVKKENNYDIEILGVSTFDEIIDYLEKL